MSSSTTWPTGVIARYLTVGGATVDITDDTKNGWVSARCLGCLWADRRLTDCMYDDTVEQTAEHIAKVLPALRRLSQSHAETCRAMPAPAK